MPAYDTVPEAEQRIPEWIADTVHTRNTVTVLPECLQQVQAIQSRLVQYRNQPEEFMRGRHGVVRTVLYVCMLTCILQTY